MANEACFDCKYINKAASEYPCYGCFLRSNGKPTEYKLDIKKIESEAKDVQKG